MPESLRRAVHQLVCEAVQNCQEVLRYTDPDQADTWQRMTLYRATDAADTMNMVATLIAACCQRTGMAPESLESYLQAGQQHSRAAGPGTTTARTWPVCWARGSPTRCCAPQLRMLHSRGLQQAQQAQALEDDPQKLFTEACLHGLRARLCDDVDALDSYLPPRVAELARKIAEVLEVPQPAPT
ncbi:hypothetical protein C0036_14855 [Streptomyces sp. DJ]|nr:hypothetical protein C0036_14855 [Streptomyces sp. DJ]